MRATIRDPQGLVHTIAFEDGHWHGYENIAHGWEPSYRQAIIEQVLLALQLRRPTLPHGFQNET